MNASVNETNLATVEGEAVAGIVATETALVKGLVETGIMTVNVAGRESETQTGTVTKRIMTVAVVSATMIVKTETTETAGVRGTRLPRTCMKTARRESAKMTGRSRPFLRLLHPLDCLPHRLPCLTVPVGPPVTTTADIATR